MAVPGFPAIYLDVELSGSSALAHDRQTRDWGIFQGKTIRLRLPIPRQRLHVGLPHFWQSPP